MTSSPLKSFEATIRNIYFLITIFSFHILIPRTSLFAITVLRLPKYITCLSERTPTIAPGPNKSLLLFLKGVSLSLESAEN